MKQLLLVLFLTLTPAAYLTAATVKGWVKDAQTGEELIGAAVYVKENPAMGTTAGLDGTFVLKDVPEGKNITLVCSYISYETQEQNVNTLSGRDVLFNMKPSAMNLEGVTIIAANPGRTEAGARGIEKQAMNVVNVMSAKAIELSPDITVANVIQRMSGVTVERNSSGEGQYAILRGMDKRYNYTLVNGVKIPSPDNKNRFVPLDIFPSEMLDRLEVTKSLTANMEGDGIGGAVNLIMKDAPSERQFTANLSTGYNAMYFGRDFQSFNRGGIVKKSPYEALGKPEDYKVTMEDFTTSNLRMKWKKPLPDLTAGLSYGDRFFDDKLGVMLAGSFLSTSRGKESRLYYQPGTSHNGIEYRNYSSEQTRIGVHAKLDYSLNDNHKLTYGKHDVGALIGYEESRNWGDEVDICKEGMSSVNLTDFDAMTDPYYIKGSSYEYSSRSWFGRINYAFDNRYLFEMNMRYDGSSRFSPDSRWGLFPSFSAGWRISEEEFMKDIDWLSNLKLRASWGKLGNNSIGNYEWQALYGSGYNYAFNSNKSNGLAMTTFSNYALEWEETAITNIGLDFGVLNNRLNGTIEVYDKKTDGILYRPTLPESLNQFTSPLQNLAGVNNKGLEITLGWNDRVGDISYSVSGNFTYNKNKVTKYKGELVREWRTDANGKKVWYQNVGTVANGSSNLIVEGHEMNEYYMMNPYKGNGSYFNSDGTVNINGGPKDGMIRTEADMKWLQAMFDAGYKFYPNQAIGKDKIWYGDMIYADYNGDGIYGNDDDRDFQGVSWRPKYYFGLQASMTWKGFDLSMNWAGAAGFKIDYYKQTQNSVSVTHGYGLGYDIAYDHYFFDPENPNDPRTNIYSETPRLVGYQNSGQASATSSWHLKNGNYIKLKNLTIGYTFPKEWMKVAFIQNARVYLSGENLLTITKFEGSDPERMAGDGYMPIRQYTVGVNVTF